MHRIVLDMRTERIGFHLLLSSEGEVARRPGSGHRATVGRHGAEGEGRVRARTVGDDAEQGVVAGAV